MLVFLYQYILVFCRSIHPEMCHQQPNENILNEVVFRIVVMWVKGYFYLKNRLKIRLNAIYHYK